MPKSEEGMVESLKLEPEQEGAETAEKEKKPEACKDPWKEGFRFDDPYWDEAFDSFYSPTLRTCCLRYF